ncbi:hypothetical protein MTO96_050324 [Rhipicephalus appendiculatus]
MHLPRVPPCERCGENVPHGTLSVHYTSGCKSFSDITDEVGATPRPAEASPAECCEVMPALGSNVNQLAEETRIVNEQLQELDSGLTSSAETIRKLLKRIDEVRRVQEHARCFERRGHLYTAWCRSPRWRAGDAAPADETNV